MFAKIAVVVVGLNVAAAVAAAEVEVKIEIEVEVVDVVLVAGRMRATVSDQFCTFRVQEEWRTQRRVLGTSMGYDMRT